MSDIGLLERAAKAAGYELEWYCRGANNPNGEPNVACVNGSEWNPLTDDGDALRLAVKLRMQVAPGTFREGTAGVYAFGLPVICEHTEENVDILSATRRAIVMAAAAIGSQDSDQ